MSLFSWLSSPKKAAKNATDSVVSSGLSRMESTKPFPGRPAQDGGNGRPANRKTERMARREVLYGVVRDCMSKAGVISASYKFKVLSLDSRGRQFLIMVDLSREYGVEVAKLEGWRDRALAGMEAGLKERAEDPLEAELENAKARLGELVMENELLRGRSGPFGLRRLRK